MCLQFGMTTVDAAAEAGMQKFVRYALATVWQV
jgi:hypothetical protein